jgi:hypothetical protein
MSDCRALLVKIAVLVAVGAACTSETSLGRSGAGGAPTSVGGVTAGGGATGSGGTPGGTGGGLGTGGGIGVGTGGTATTMAGGATGTGGPAQLGGTTASGGSAGMAGVTGVGGSTTPRTGGTTGHGGSMILDGGPVDAPASLGGAGSGGASSGGAGGAGTGGTATGGAGGSAACQQASSLDSSCLVDSDCVAVNHTTNCCGAAVWLGINKAGAQAFSTFESACDASYPRCGCGSGVPTASDGSSIGFGVTAEVTCQGGVCKTYASACGHPCETGRSCITCGAMDAGTSVCTLQCPSGTGCTEAPYTKCQSSMNGSICVSPDLTWCSGY